MLVVKMYLFPGGREEGSYQIGEMHVGRIAESGEGKDQLGEYEVRVYNEKFLPPEGIDKPWKQTEVINYPRQNKDFGAWDLIFLALKNAIGYRAKRLPLKTFRVKERNTSRRYGA